MKDSLGTLARYIETENPQGFRQFLKEGGENPKAGVSGAKRIVGKEGEEGVGKLLSHHPDREAILDLFGRVKCSCQNKNTQIISQPNVYWFGGTFAVLLLLFVLLIFTRKKEEN